MNHKQGRLASQQSNSTKSVAADYHEGPLPSPLVLEKYDLIVPGAAERILAMAEKDQDEFLKLRKFQVRSSTFQVYLGQFFAFLFCIGSLYISYTAIINGQPWAAAILGAMGVASVVASFLRK